MPKLLSQVPWRISPRPGLESRSTIDYILQPLFLVSYVYLSFTLVRLFWALTLLPIYLLLAFLRSVWPALLRNGGLLLTSKGRARLIQDGHQTFADRERQGEQQFSDDYRFPAGSFEHGWQHNGPPGNLAAIWPVNREYINVCGLKACVVHEKPAGPVVRTVVLLHGNPSWSFMFRHIIAELRRQDFEILALDWIGFGGSDKPLDVEDISFELHMRTLITLFDTYRLSGAFILAHDWGGCVALSSIPHLAREDPCTGLMLLNSFFPPRPSDISWNAYLLYILWLSAQGILAALIPEAAIIRYMAPSVTKTIAEGYAAPFSAHRSKAAVTRFARIVPGTPQLVYDAFESPVGRLLDGICSSRSFSSLHEQARLRKRDAEVRSFWGSGKGKVRVRVAFGNRDSLLGDFFPLLLRSIFTSFGSPERDVLDGAGHYAAEEQPEEISQAFIAFASP